MDMDAKLPCRKYRVLKLVLDDLFILSSCCIKHIPYWKVRYYSSSLAFCVPHVKSKPKWYDPKQTLHIDTYTPTQVSLVKLLTIPDWAPLWATTLTPSLAHRLQVGWARPTKYSKRWLPMACFQHKWWPRDTLGCCDETLMVNGDSAHPVESVCSHSDQPRHSHSHTQTTDRVKPGDFIISLK